MPLKIAAPKWEIKTLRKSATVFAADGLIVATVFGDDKEMVEGNAKLIAAAPEMLRLLKEVSAQYGMKAGMQEINNFLNDLWYNPKP